MAIDVARSTNSPKGWKSPQQINLASRDYYKGKYTALLISSISNNQASHRVLCSNTKQISKQDKLIYSSKWPKHACTSTIQIGLFHLPLSLCLYLFSHPHRKHTCITHGPAQTISTHGSCTRLNGRQWWQQAQLLWKERHTCFTQVFDRKRKKTPKSHQVTKNLSENHPQISWRKKKSFPNNTPSPKLKIMGT